MARRRTLSPEDRALWDRVAETTRPLHKRAPPRPPQPPVPPGPAARTPPIEPGHKPPAPLPLFRIGGAAPPVPERIDLAPTIAERLAAGPLRIDARALAALRRGRTAPEARIDLHGLTLAEARPALTGFVLRGHAEGLRRLLVITGKGLHAASDAPLPVRPGALRHAVPEWLARPPLSGVVLAVAQAHRRHGGEGALYVFLRRARGPG